MYGVYNAMVLLDIMTDAIRDGMGLPERKSSTESQETHLGWSKPFIKKNK